MIIKKIPRKIPLIYQIRRDLKRKMSLMGIIRNTNIPDPLFEDDIFLVSYPKSGNTWLRFMLAHLQFADAPIDFHTISDYIPAGASTADRVWHTQINRMRPRFIKSHVRYQPRFPRVIYLVRDGRDAYVSYYRFLFGRLPEGTTLAEFITKRDLRFGTWSQHVNSWLNANLPSDRFVMIKYENMLRNPFKVLKRIAAFGKIHWSEVQMRKAIAQTTFDKMRKIEEEKGLPPQNVFSGRFMRQGKAQAWRKEFGELEKRIFKRYHNSALVRLGYEDDNAWQ